MLRGLRRGSTKDCKATPSKLGKSVPLRVTIPSLVLPTREPYARRARSGPRSGVQDCTLSCRSIETVHGFAFTGGRRQRCALSRLRTWGCRKAIGLEKTPGQALSPQRDHGQYVPAYIKRQCPKGRSVLLIVGTAAWGPSDSTPGWPLLGPRTSRVSDPRNTRRWSYGVRCNKSAGQRHGGSIA